MFYFTGSAFTHYKEDYKRKFDIEVRGGGGQRTWKQVLATAGLPAALCIVYLWLTNGAAAGLCYDASAENEVSTAVLLAYLGAFACVCGDTWASELGILSRTPPRLVTSILSCGCTRAGRPGDLASPRIWPWRWMVVPRGTNGGMSGWGTFVSAAGGTAMGVVMALEPAVQAVYSRLPRPGAGAGDDAASPSLGCDSAASPIMPQWALLLLIGTAAGLVGSVIDSILGAVLQRSWFEPWSGRASAVLPSGGRPLTNARHRYNEEMLTFADEFGANAADASKTKKKNVDAASSSSASSTSAGSDDSKGSGASSSVADGAARKRNPSSSQSPSPQARAAFTGGLASSPLYPFKPHEFIPICGRDIVSNEGVNFLSGAITAGLTAYFGGLVLRWAQLQVLQPAGG